MPAAVEDQVPDVTGRVAVEVGELGQDPVHHRAVHHVVGGRTGAAAVQFGDQVAALLRIARDNGLLRRVDVGEEHPVVAAQCGPYVVGGREQHMRGPHLRVRDVVAQPPQGADGALGPAQHVVEERRGADLLVPARALDPSAGGEEHAALAQAVAEGSVHGDAEHLAHQVGGEQGVTRAGRQHQRDVLDEFALHPHQLTPAQGLPGAG